MAKVMVSLPDEVLMAVDLEAKRRGTTRSGLLREFAEASIRERSIERAKRMTQIAAAGPASGHGGRAADLVKATRPAR